MPQVRRGGRPSREASEQLGELILDAATEMFLAQGFGATSIDAVATHLRMSKRTFYHRFPDKEALFAAVVHRIIQRLRPAANIPLIEGADLKTVLERLAALILHAALSPQAIALNRLIVAESARFPELARVLAHEGATEEATTLIAGILEREVTAGRFHIADPRFYAQQFLQMVVTLPQRRAMGLGAPMSPEEFRGWPHKVADLFLHGCRADTPKR
jgi:TetR/AcrR family transcriptional regulator, mexJK operon transcriptional repressor